MDDFSDKNPKNTDTNGGKLLYAVKNYGIITVVRGIEEDCLFDLFSALKAGGIKIAEITFGLCPDEKIAKQLEKVVLKFGPDMMIGAGTVTTKERARLSLEAGVKYIVSPVFGGDITDFAKAHNLGVISGGLTPNEIKRAYDLGADLVKVFPADAFGPSYIKSIVKPLNNIPLVGFGGIKAFNAAEYLKAGLQGLGVGSAITDPGSIDSCDFEAVRKKAEDFVNIFNGLKAGKTV